MSNNLIDISKHYPSIPEYAKIFYITGFSYLINYSIRGKVRLNVDTLAWCNFCQFDEETTLIWVLKYGDKLPTDVKQL